MKVENGCRYIILIIFLVSVTICIICLHIKFACQLFITELKQLSEATEKATISEVTDVPSQKQASAAELGGLSKEEKKRLVAQYDCESDGDSEYPIKGHLVLYYT